MKKYIPIQPETQQRIHNSHKLTESWIPKVPSIYQIEVMSRCDFGCTFCQTGVRGGPYQGSPYIDRELFNTIVERDLGGSSFVELQFRGEPTLNKHLKEFVLKLRSKVLVGFSTHGNLLHSHHAFFAALNSHYITISMDAGEKELYEQYRLGGCWERLIQNINLLVTKKGINPLPIIDLQLIEFEGFEEQVEKLQKVSDENGWNLYQKDSVRIRTVKDTQSSFINKESIYSHELCTNPWYSVSIKANGDVVPCCMAFEDEKDMMYGNLKEHSLEEIWNSNIVHDFRKRHRDNEALSITCQRCTARSPHNLHQTIAHDIVKRTLLCNAIPTMFE